MGHRFDCGRTRRCDGELPPRGDDAGGKHTRVASGAGGRRPLVAVVVLAMAAALLSACSSPGLISQSCTRTTEGDPVLATLAGHLRVHATLRNAQVVKAAGGRQFVSAELHRPDDAFAVRGDILTWVSDGARAFRSVDRNARRYSSWPAATADLRRAEARTSRGCVYPYRGRKTCAPGNQASPLAAPGQCRQTSSPSTTSPAPGGTGG